MKFSYSPWLAALTVATTTAAANLVNVSPATAASIKYGLRLEGIPVEGGIFDRPIKINTDFGSFTVSDSTIESVDLGLEYFTFDQGIFVTDNSETNILFSNSSEPTQSLTLFGILPLPQEIGGMEMGDATLINGDRNASVTYKLSAVAHVPEPLTLLGSAAALGFGVVLKQEHSRKKNKVNE
jgi:hypothetical protein